MINIYTDGSCINNGKKNSSGAIGVFYSDNDSRNIAKVINEGKITNQTMELLACINALQNYNNNEKIFLFTDSKYVINCMTSWIYTWQKNNWQTSKGKPVENKDLIQKLHSLAKKNIVIFKHVSAHSEAPSIDDINYQHWYGNKKADEFATSANKNYLKNMMHEQVENKLKSMLKN